MTNDVKASEIVDEIIEDEDVIALEDKPKAVTPDDPEWTDYFISLLTDRELPQGNPTTAGIRRVTGLIFGKILVSDTDLLELAHTYPKDVVVAKHRLVIERGNQVIEVSACVDVVGDKLPYPYKEHLVATACTKAEGKALRRALKLNIYTAEELTNDTNDEEDMGLAINDQQIMAIKTLCKRLDIDLIALVKQTANKATSIKEVTNLQGRMMISTLSEYQREGTPPDLKGYNENWTQDFGG